MSFLDDVDDLRAVSEEWGTSARTILALAGLMQLARDAGVTDHEETLVWLVAGGYLEVRDDAMRVTVAGYQRALG